MSSPIQPIDPQLIRVVMEQRNQEREDRLRQQGQLLEQAHGIALAGQPVPQDLLNQLGAPSLAEAVKQFGLSVRQHNAELQAQKLIDEQAHGAARTINPSGQGFQPQTPEQSQLQSLIQNQIQNVNPALQSVYQQRLQGTILGAETAQQEKVAQEKRTEAEAVRTTQRQEQSEERVAAYRGGVQINVDKAKQALDDRSKTADAVAQGFAGIASGTVPPENNQELGQIMAKLTPTEQQLVRSRIIESTAQSSDVREVTQALIASGIPDVTPAKAKAVIDKKLIPMGALGLVPATDPKSLEQTKAFLDAMTALDRMKTIATDIASRGVITRIPGALGMSWQDLQRKLGDQDPAFAAYDFATFALSESLNRALLQGGRVTQQAIERLMKELPGTADLVKANTPTALSKAASSRFQSAMDFMIDRGKYSPTGSAAFKQTAAPAIPASDKVANSSDSQLRLLNSGGP